MLLIHSSVSWPSTSFEAAASIWEAGGPDGKFQYDGNQFWPLGQFIETSWQLKECVPSSVSIKKLGKSECLLAASEHAQVLVKLFIISQNVSVTLTKPVGRGFDAQLDYFWYPVEDLSIWLITKMLPITWAKFHICLIIKLIQWRQNVLAYWRFT